MRKDPSVPQRTPEDIIRKSRKSLLLYSILAFLFTTTMIKILVSDTKSGWILALGFVLFFLWKAKQTLEAMKAAKDFKVYMHQLSLSKDNSLSSLSNLLNLPENHVKKNLLTMVKIGLIESLVFSPQGVMDLKGIENLSFKLKSSQVKMGEMVRITCSSCGAPVNLERGTGRKCDYCHSPVSAPLK